MWGCALKLFGANGYKEVNTSAAGVMDEEPFADVHVNSQTQRENASAREEVCADSDENTMASAHTKLIFNSSNQDVNMNFQWVSLRAHKEDHARHHSTGLFCELTEDHVKDDGCEMAMREHPARWQ